MILLESESFVCEPPRKHEVFEVCLTLLLGDLEFMHGGWETSDGIRFYRNMGPEPFEVRAVLDATFTALVRTSDISQPGPPASLA